MTFKFPFLKLLSALGKDSTQLVLVGGWVPAVYFTYLWPGDYFLVTRDIDLGIEGGSQLSPDFEQRIGAQHFKRKHRDFGKERPYQLIFDGSPIDFLTDSQHLAAARKRVVGDNIIVSPMEGYDALLKDTVSVSCDGVLVRVPNPAAYLIHKIQLYFENYAERQRDIATAYYCLTRESCFQSAKEALARIKQPSAAVNKLRKDLPEFLRRGGLIVRDVQKVFLQYGRSEDEADIIYYFTQWLSEMNQAVS